MNAPQIVTRAHWGARPPAGAWEHWPPGQPSGHTGHWEGAGGHSDHSRCAAEVRSIQAYHLNNGYIDIAYNWIVCIHGVVFEGRPVAFRSAAQRGGNPLRISICYMAGAGWVFTSAARAAFAWIIGRNAPDVCIPHADEPTCQTSCAGDVINSWIRHGGYKQEPAPTPHVHPAPKPQPLPAHGFHHPVLGHGAKGPAVLELQFKLIAAFGQHIGADGDFGPHTAEAVRNVQRFFHLNVDGVAGPKTWGVVDYVFASKHH